MDQQQIDEAFAEIDLRAAARNYGDASEDEKDRVAVTLKIAAVKYAAVIQKGDKLQRRKS